MELYTRWLQKLQSNGKALESSRRLSFYNICSSYRDVLCRTRPENSRFIDSYVIHLLNHTLKSIDQGFTRPKVLILVPSARAAHLLVKKLFQLSPSANMANAEGLGKFNTNIVGDTENESFVFSIKLERENIRLYGAYSSSDIIVASPLGLVTKIWLAEKSETRDADPYLSSIELLVVDYSHGKAMKNWSYVPKIVEYLNGLRNVATDIRPLRRWHVDGQAQFYRQTIILTSSLSPDVKDLLHFGCANFEGKLLFSHGRLLARGFIISPLNMRELPRCKPSLPDGDCIIALSYPPGNKLMSFVQKKKVHNFFIPENFPKDLAVHGAWQMREEPDKRNSEGANIELTQEWERLLRLCMPNVQPSKVMKNMKNEFIRHGRAIHFLNERNYVQFTVGVYMTYKFDALMNFVASRIAEEGVCVKELSYLGNRWIGIPLKDLTRLFEDYSPTSGSELIVKLFYHHCWLFFYETSTYVTRDGKFGKRQGAAIRVIDYEAKDPHDTVTVTDESYVYFLSM